MMKWFSFSCLFLIIPLLLSAQKQIRLNEGSAIMVPFSYGFQFSAGDLAERFDNNGMLQLGVEYWTPNSFIFGVQSGFQFGSDVKEDVLATLRTEEGFLISTDRQVADVRLRQRGFYSGAFIGKLFQIDPNNPRSGIRVDLGSGLLQHKIRIQDDPNITVASLLDDYRKGYDRLTNGLALSQYIGYQVLSRNRRINLSVGADFIQGFTQNRRSFDFDTQMQDTRERLDLLWGLRATLTLPFYLESKGTEGIIY